MTRHGIVLGAGGVLGFTWSVAALHAWEQETGLDARDADIRVGTSAGSILAGLLGLGVGTDTILRHQQGASLAEDRNLEWDYDVDGGGTRPPLPKLGFGSPGLLLSVLKHPGRIPPLAAMSGIMPRGQASLAPLERMLERLAEGSSDWPERDSWIIAMDYATGDREVFGRLGSPKARLSQAVHASCSIPGWYRPVRIGRRSYVDGGALSSTSVDLLAGAGLGEVVVIAPMAARSYDRPSTTLAKLERRWRRSTTKRVLQEIATVQASGTYVRLLCPGPADLVAMGANLMDHRRRLAVLDTAMRTAGDQLTKAAAGCR
ncbi:MAG: patatin-like phospholipase family protein [Geodermatophilaceae bacterium]|nr:patatin-like phospholipase family protein [Geodermatophilaceae bacterium]